MSKNTITLIILVFITNFALAQIIDPDFSGYMNKICQPGMDKVIKMARWKDCQSQAGYVANCCKGKDNATNHATWVTSCTLAQDWMLSKSHGCFIDDLVAYYEKNKGDFLAAKAQTPSPQSATSYEGSVDGQRKHPNNNKIAAKQFCTSIVKSGDTTNNSWETKLNACTSTAANCLRKQPFDNKLSPHNLKGDWLNPESGYCARLTGDYLRDVKKSGPVVAEQNCKSNAEEYLLFVDWQNPIDAKYCPVIKAKVENPNSSSQPAGAPANGSGRK